jgi:hypothetical protein
MIDIGWASRRKPSKKRSNCECSIVCMVMLFSNFSYSAAVGSSPWRSRWQTSMKFDFEASWSIG